MKKKKTFIAIAATAIAVSGIISLYFMGDRNKKAAPESGNEAKSEMRGGREDFSEDKTALPLTLIIENKLREIEIYDIEEGYLTVPYNKDAKPHDYNWDNLSEGGMGRYTYEDGKYMAKSGIDVSAYQGAVDWEQVKNAGIDFAILRLGFRGYGEAGRITADAAFEENARQAALAGVDTGVYFFSQAISEEEAIEEAEYVLGKIRDKELKYPVYFDLEKIKNDTARTDNLEAGEVTKITLAFCREIEKAGYTPGIYGNAKAFTTRMHLEKLNDYPKWYADYQKKPLYPYGFSMWQYTEKGRVPGIEGNVDINLYFIPK